MRRQALQSSAPYQKSKCPRRGPGAFFVIFVIKEVIKEIDPH